MYASGSDISYVPEVPVDEQAKVSRLSMELNQEQLNIDKNIDNSISKLSQQYQNEIRQLIKPDHLEHYIERRMKYRQKMRDLAQKIEPTYEGHQKILEARNNEVESSKRFLKEINFDIDRASKIQKEYDIKSEAALRKLRQLPDEPNYVVLTEAVPKDVHNPWATYEPPYPGYAWSYYWARSDEPYTPILTRYLNTAAGQLGTYTRNHVRGADDSDYSYVRYNTGMRFWYQIPVAGMVELWMSMRCINTNYSGDLDDEWGWSSSRVEEDSRAYLRVIGPGSNTIRKSTILDYTRTGTDATWSRQVTAPGNRRWAHLFSSDAYAAGTWLLLEAGTEEWNYFRTNDVTIHSSMTMRWTLNRVYARSSGE